MAGRPVDPGGGLVPHAFFVGLARAKCALGMAPAEVSARRKKSLEGRNGCTRKGGTRLYLTNGMAREAAQELGGKQSQGAMDRVYDRARPEDVAPEMRGVLGRARTTLGVEGFLRESILEVAFDGNG